jgi:hypothetical protein
VKFKNCHKEKGRAYIVKIECEMTPRKMQMGENDVYKEAFIGLCMMILIAMWKNFGKMIMNTIIRCLFCLVCVYLCNGFIQYFGGNISVKINEITLGVSAIFGWSGIGALYILQWFLTTH